MVHHGDLFDVLPTLNAESIDGCVHDPPYGVGFMGKEWDSFLPSTAAKKAGLRQDGGISRWKENNPNLKGRTVNGAISSSQIEYDRGLDGQRAFQAWTERWAGEVLRVLKPGAYIVVFGAPRSYHRMACGLEDAGFVIRDKFSWLFLSGFPKSLNFGCKCGENPLPSGPSAQQPGQSASLRPPSRTLDDRASERGTRCERCGGLTSAVGKGTALKPSHEPICIAWKPFKGSITGTYIKHGTAAFNIDDCRTGGDAAYRAKCASVVGLDSNRNGNCYGEWVGEREDSSHPLGRWPSNVLLECPEVYPHIAPFLYCAKPSREERDYGCEGLRARSGGETTDRADGSAGLNSPRAGAGRTGRAASGGSRNFHPT